MKLILSEQCKSLTGCLARGLGYFIQARRTKSGMVNYFSQRSKYGAPPDGHWRFIVACAELAQKHLHISDIEVKQEEVDAARMEAGLKAIAYCLPCRVLNAGDVMYIVNHFGL